VSQALVDCCPVNGEQTIEAAMGNEPHKAYVKAIISGFPEQQRRSWQTAFDTNAYPTVQSLLRAIMQESTRIHSNSDKLQEQTDFEAREPRHAGSKNEGGGRGSGKWSRKGGKSKGRGGGKSADVEPYFQGRCDNCGAHGHKAVSCRQPVRQTWQPGHDVRGGKKDASRDYVKGKSGKKGFGQRKGEKSGKKGKKGKFGRDASVADGASAEMPTVAAAMQPGALVEFGRDGDSYEAVFGDDESTLRPGLGSMVVTGTTAAAGRGTDGASPSRAAEETSIPTAGSHGAAVYSLRASSGWRTTAAQSAAGRGRRLAKDQSGTGRGRRLTRNQSAAGRGRRLEQNHSAAGRGRRLAQDQSGAGRGRRLVASKSGAGKGRRLV
jgi:hypothetical protein